MTKILIDAVAVREMLDKHPEIELELTKNAAAQIAEQFKRKVLNDQGTLVDRLIEEINSKLNYKYHLPKQVLDVIRSAVEGHVKHLAENEAETMARTAFAKALDSYARQMDSKIDAIVIAKVEKKVAAVFAAAARLK